MLGRPSRAQISSPLVPVSLLLFDQDQNFGFDICTDLSEEVLNGFLASLYMSVKFAICLETVQSAYLSGLEDNVLHLFPALHVSFEAPDLDACEQRR